MQVRITRIEFSGHSVFDEATLQAVIDDALDSEQDLAGLREIANRLSRYYRERGYPFAHAILPPQTLSNGVLKITLFEGRYGKVRASGDDALAAQAQPWLDALQAGEVIAAGPLERTTLLLGDQPGLHIVPVMRPGEAVGSGDLDVRVSPGKRVRISLGLDNHGSQSSGRGRVHAAVLANRLLTLGDELSATALYSEEDLWLGRIGYSLPLGYRGLRGEIAYARTEYDLGKPFAGFTGTADIGSARLSYPVVRSQRSNLIASLSYRHKKLDDRLNEISYQRRDSDSWSLVLQFDHRDSLGGGGVSYGELGLTDGDLSNDAAGATEGNFSYASLDLSRIQSLPGRFSLWANARVQWADTPLDSSEAMSLGGANGVRAYPQGEVSGSRVWLARLEARYQAPAQLTPYLFFDQGQRESYRDETEERRAGGGLGLRYSGDAWGVDAAVAFQSTGEAATEDDQRDPRFWIQAAYHL
jgi:hemolysin activation/secretion protein